MLDKDTTAILLSLLLLSCAQPQKPTTKQSVIVDKKELECKRKNWNQVPKSEGYVQDVVKKDKYELKKYSNRQKRVAIATLSNISYNQY